MSVRILIGDCRASLAALPERSVQACVTSPPYWGLRDYGHAGQLGLEQTPEAYVAAMVDVFRAVRRVLRDDGTLWLNLGDSYTGGGGFTPDAPSNVARAERGNHEAGAFGFRLRDHDAKRDAGRRPSVSGIKPKNLIGIPWRVAFALQADGWYLRSDIIWSKPNPMPESVTDRPTKAHEYLFLLSKSERYVYDAVAIQEQATGRDPGNVTHKGTAAYAAGDEFHRTKGGLLSVGARDVRNRRSVWTVATQPYSGAHFATMPPALVEPCILAGSARGDTVLDPFGGAGTTALVADRLGRDAIICELNPEYAALAESRIRDDVGMLADVNTEDAA